MQMMEKSNDTSNYESNLLIPKVDILEMFKSGKLVKVSAPMVRYSKLPFRLTVSDFGTDICYTPMIMADSFVNSQVARDLELQISPKHNNVPLVVQFAANQAKVFATATQLVAAHVAAVDLNCGCPQGWALGEGIGAALMSKPELIRDMISQARMRSGQLPISVKIRTFTDAHKTVELARILEAAGASWLTVHGRTKSQKSSEPVDYDMIKLVKESIQIPVVANGDIFTLQDAESISLATGVNGVMAARGLLENPGLFAGHQQTSWEVVDTFVKYSMLYGTTGPIFHHHLAKMTSHLFPPNDYKLFNGFSSASVPTMLDFLDNVRNK